jgi:alkanesulfonate monooxygenase SsuD/methylene tetrahydromethanopterin reductase-like flavin-dependent oxidoreductase (luciferase family)
VAVGVWAICAETDDEAQRLAASARMAMAMLRRGRLIAVPPPDKAVRFLESEGQALDAMPPGRRTVVGSPARVAEGLREVAEAYGADEVVVVSITYEHDARRRSYELIAEAFDLAGAAGAQRIAS